MFIELRTVADEEKVFINIDHIVLFSEVIIDNKIGCGYSFQTEIILSTKVTINVLDSVDFIREQIRQQSIYR